jgi:hypothetical protein
MTVVVEPDTVGPWLGLVGVAVGVLLTAGVTGLQQRRKERRERQAALLQACSDLDAAVQNLRIYSGAFRALRPPQEAARRVPLLQRRHKPPVDPYRGDSPLAWAKALSAAMERINGQAAMVSQLAPGPLGSAAWALARDAMSMTHGGEAASNQLTASALQFREIRTRVLGK